MSSRPIALALLALLALPALATAGGPLVVVPDEHALALPAALARALPARRRSISRRGFHEALQRLAAERALQAARRAADQGTRALAELRHAEAEAALRTALAAYAAAQPLPHSCSEAYDAARALSFLYWQRKQLEPARRWRLAAARLARAAIDPTRYEPSFVAFWQAADDPPPIPSTIALRDGGHAQATVWIGCRALGAPPLAVAIGGAALVLVTREGARASAVLEPTRSQLFELAPARGTHPAAADETQALLAQRGAQELLWLRRSGAGWAVDRFEQRSGWQRDAQRISEREAAAAAPAAAASTVPAPGRARATPAAVWVLGGTALAALAAGAISAGVARAAGDEIERQAAAGELFDAADEQRNRVARAVSYVSFAVAGALAVTATITWFWSARRAPRAAPRAALSAPRLCLSW